MKSISPGQTAQTAQADLGWYFSFSRCIKPLPHMPILGSSNSAANKNRMSKIWKTGWEKEKLLVMSNFFFSHNVFKSCLLLMALKMSTYGERVNPFPNKPWFLRVCSTSLLKTPWEKEKLLVMSNFSFFYSVFYLFGELTAIFITFEIVVCKLFEFGRV